MSEIHHDRQPAFTSGQTFRWTERIWPDDFDLVGVASTDDLDEIFELTNHKWNGVKLVGRSEPPRSTSVGDIVVNSKGEVFMCLAVGWRYLGTPEKKIVCTPPWPSDEK